MDRRSRMRAGASALGAFSFASMLAIATGAADCSPLQLDFAIGEAGPPDASLRADAYDAVDARDATIDEASPSADADSGPTPDAIPSGDADAAVPSIPCSTGTDCTSYPATPLCNKDAGVCVECLSPSDCSSNGNTPHCVRGLCVACNVSADCDDGGMEGGMVCNTWIPRCASTCTSGAVCTQQGLYCSIANGYCVACLDDTYCVGKSTGTHCYVPAGVCGCQSGADCPSGSMSSCGLPSPTGNRFCE